MTPASSARRSGCWQKYDAEVHKIGGLTPPLGWVNHREHMVAARRDGDQVTVTVMDAATGEVVATLTEPVAPVDVLVDAYRRADLIPGPRVVSRPKTTPSS